MTESQIDAIRKVLDEAKASSGLGSDDPSVAALEQIMQTKIAALTEAHGAIDATPPPTGATVLFAPTEETEADGVTLPQCSPGQLAK